ncbi:MAG: nuclear transport factor 2 family protein [Novosphingobium sp.]|nr:nuclear transport factor 2 family protein [Novosphingobium sp.]
MSGTPLPVPVGMTGVRTMDEQSHSATTRATRGLAMKFLRMAFVDKQFRSAFDSFVAPDFIQHNPHIADGWEGHRAFFGRMAERLGDSADWHHVTDMVLADGELFAVMHRVFRSPDDHGQIVVDLWRVADGKMVEHWDVIQQMPRTMPHGNGMGSAVANDPVSAKAYRDSVEQPACGKPDAKVTREQSLASYRAYVDEVAKGDVLGATETWLHPEYKQHSPVIADGKQGAIDYLMEEWGKKDAPNPILGPQRIVAEGDFVLVHYLYSLEGVPGEEAHIDVFRFMDNKIVEHWDVKQKVPETTASGRAMW